jgi:hypothetical protein
LRAANVTMSMRRPHFEDVQLHELLTKPARSPMMSPPPPSVQPETLPEPVFPQRPELLGEGGFDLETHRAVVAGKERHWTAALIYRAMKGWMFPYIRSRLLPGDFHPIIAYLFTEWKCNLDCH